MPEKIHSANPLALGNVRVSGSGGGDGIHAIQGLDGAKANQSGPLAPPINPITFCWRPKLAITEADRSGPVIRVGLGFCV